MKPSESNGGGGLDGGGLDGGGLEAILHAEQFHSDEQPQRRSGFAIYRNGTRFVCGAGNEGGGETFVEGTGRCGAMYYICRIIVEDVCFL